MTERLCGPSKDRPSSPAGHPGFPAMGRRELLKAAGGLAAGGLAAALAGCAAPAPEPEPFDPTSLVYPPPPEIPRFYYDRTIWGSTSVTEESSTDRFKRFATGQSERGTGMAKPFGVAAQDGRVFVSDTVSRRVHVFDFPSKRYYDIGTKGVGRMTKPMGMALDQSGKLYVVDNTARRVLIYDLEGGYINSIGHDAGFERATAVAVTPDGDRIYVLDTGGVQNSNHQVLLFNASGRLLKTIGTRGEGDGEFNLPLDCALGPDGRLYVLDTGNFRVQVFDPEGNFLSTFGGAGRFAGDFSHPKGIAIDAENKIYVTDTAFGIFQIFDGEGQILMSIGDRSEAGATPASFLLPSGIAVDFDSRIYVADQFHRKVEVFRPAAVPEDWPVGQRLV